MDNFNLQELYASLDKFSQQFGKVAAETMEHAEERNWNALLGDATVLAHQAATLETVAKSMSLFERLGGLEA